MFQTHSHSSLGWFSCSTGNLRAASVSTTMGKVLVYGSVHLTNVMCFFERFSKTVKKRQNFVSRLSGVLAARTKSMYSELTVSLGG